jgi:hypothetical protein
MDALDLGIYALVDNISSKYYGGVFASDKLIPDVSGKETFYIVNAGKSQTRGSHWLVVYNKDVPKFFDSLGKPLDEYDKTFKDFVINQGARYIISPCKIQVNCTNSCGKFI